jgi:phytoene dehydrogenase-like protein
MWGMSPYELGFLFPLYVYRMTDAALVRGGSHRLSSALYRTFLESGGTVMDRAEVVRVLVKNGGVQGVMIEDGTEISAKAVISTCNPRQNFLEFIDAKDLPAELVDSARRWEWEKTTFFGVHLALRTAPTYSDVADANRALTTFFGVSDTAYLLDHLESTEHGVLPARPMGHATCPSLFDPLQAPEGYHVGRWECLVPFDVNWETKTEAYTRSCLAEWKKYAPNIDPLNALSYPPTYIEMKNKSMVRGSFKHGAYIPLQMGYLRPNDLCSRSFTPVERFYVAGASSYPGGMILGGGGYLAANTIVNDFGLTRTWEEPEYMEAARMAGIIPG